MHGHLAAAILHNAPVLESVRLPIRVPSGNLTTAQPTTISVTSPHLRKLHLSFEVPAPAGRSSPAVVVDVQSTLVGLCIHHCYAAKRKPMDAVEVERFQHGLRRAALEIQWKDLIRFSIEETNLLPHSLAPGIDVEATFAHRIGVKGELWFLGQWGAEEEIRSSVQVSTGLNEGRKGLIGVA